MEKELTEQERTTLNGNPGKPQGEDGKKMLLRMNDGHATLTKWATDFLDIKEDDNILDIGCGGGAALNRLSQKITTGHLTGVDYSSVSVEMSKKHNEENIKNGKMDILEASVEELPFENDKFDKIITVESFYFWPNPKENIKEVFRVLKKNGTFLLILAVYKHDKMVDESKEVIKTYDLFAPTKEEFEEIFENAGFTNVKIHTIEDEDWICIEGSKD